MFRKMTMFVAAGVAVSLGWADEARAQIVLEAAADATVCTDTDKRANDNFGCDPFLKVGPGRGGGGLPFGDPDAQRALIQFDVSMFNQPVAQAVLELTISGFGLQGTPRVHTLDVHRIVNSGARTPWAEGNGDDAGAAPRAPGCTDTNAAFGVAWMGVEDGGDLNNHSQPDFDPTIYSTAMVDEPGGALPGDTVTWDVTSLVNEWITGAQPNLGLVIRDPTSNGTFHHIILTSRDAELWNGWTGRNWTPTGLGPRLKITATISVAQDSWGRVKSQYR